ncbi:unnamed protein product [[Actinomadura] parvosata subsp. kistnae]|uniref:PIN domain-containing protein n=1 Tax=[Actinomadura] parvosata subsp. kistnae TaxID=1909395 RepID=A0A1U9ZWL6_9ACTN|nr:hypothetical protein [Nonomuraea sp. ATCC 55076]AQZ62348.1 hypothetical protein BKM31_13515 [Nonomuraea sp. ATCC 55076]SPL88544.1 unnamed protein product [Actinomadura parvosata subsp. kistnae]
MIAGYVADLTAIVRLLADGEEGADARTALEVLTEDGHTLLLPVTALAQAAIIADPDPAQLMWLFGFRSCIVEDLTRQETFRVVRQARHAPHPLEVPLHHAHTAHLALDRGWPVLTGDAAGWAGYGHLEFFQV